MPRIAAIQTSSSDNIAENLAQIELCIAQSVEDGAELVILPECCAFMQSSVAQLLETAEQRNPKDSAQGEIQAAFSGLSKKYQVWVIAGSLPVKSSNPDKITNTLMVFDDLGSRVASYDKVFLFDVELPTGEVYRESSYTEAGDRLEVVDSPVGKIGLSICYDLRFPELYRKLVSRGAQLLIVPSAFSATTGKDHWLPLLRARAIENSCYVIAPAQFGIHNGKRKTWGHTVIIDPWGKVLSELESGWGVISADIDLQKLESIRAQLPSLEHIRNDLF
jgi:predicted amidohydrolase